MNLKRPQVTTQVCDRETVNKLQLTSFHDELWLLHSHKHLINQIKVIMCEHSAIAMIPQLQTSLFKAVGLVQTTTGHSVELVDVTSSTLFTLFFFLLLYFQQNVGLVRSVEQ